MGLTCVLFEVNNANTILKNTSRGKENSRFIAVRVIETLCTGYARLVLYILYIFNAKVLYILRVIKTVMMELRIIQNECKMTLTLLNIYTLSLTIHKV